MKSLRAAHRYAQALMIAAEAQKSSERTAKDLGEIAAIMRGSREFRLFMASPVISGAKKLAVLKEVFGSSILRETMNFIEMLITKHREDALLEVTEQFNVLLDEKLGIINVDVTSAVDFTTPQNQDLQTQLERYVRKKVRLRFSIDKTVRGGLLIRIGDTVLDASVRHQLELLRERLVFGTSLLNSQ